MKDGRIEVHYLTRVEGHGNIVVDVQKGVLKEVKLEIVESPRFLEAAMVGRRFPEAVHIGSRICGICAVSHTNAAINALEDALGIKPSWQTETLRRILMGAEMVDSHALHAFFLVAPDFFGVPSAVQLASKAPRAVRMGVKLKKLAHDICDTLAGRHTHPVSMTVGGFTNVVREDQVEALLREVKECLKEVPEMVEFFSGLEFPEFKRRTDYVSLTHPDEYAMYRGSIKSSETGEYKHRDYQMKIRERVVDHSTAKQSLGPHKPFMVGALARFNNNFKQLMPGAKEAAERFGLKPPEDNPFKITLAQMVELVHCLEWMASLMEELLAAGIRDERKEHPPLAGFAVRLPEVKRCWGVGVTEAPRGLLIHEYRINDRGVIEHANVITPTAQNQANIEEDMRQLVPAIIGRPKEEIQLLLEMLVRSYDPCISCATHMLEVKFI